MKKWGLADSAACEFLVRLLKKDVVESLSLAKLTKMDINTKNHKTTKIELAFTDWFLSVVVPFCRRLDGKKVIIGDNLALHFSEEVLLKSADPGMP